MRNCSDWIDSFCEYVSDTETPRIFAKWSAIATIAGALRKKCWFQLGRHRTYPNLYIILVAPPGGRKSASLNYAKELLIEGVPDVVISSESNTRESLLQDLEFSATDVIMDDKTTFRYSALTVMSKEFEIFLGQKKENAKMIVTLTDLYDCTDKMWKHRTKHSGNSTIPNVYLNLAGCTTPSSLASSFPTESIGGGLTSRMLFIYCDKREKLVSVPEWTEKEAKYKELLLKDIASIGGLRGIYNFTQKSRELYDEWYINQVKASKICKDEAFSGWYERKPLFVQKLAVICQASLNNSFFIEWKIFERAILLLEEIEETMALAFRGVGRSDITADVDMIYTIISSRNYISDSELLALTWRDIDAKKMDQVIPTLSRSGLIRVLTQSPKGESGIYYVAVKSDKSSHKEKLK